jgi:hypothetical protein
MRPSLCALRHVQRNSRAEDGAKVAGELGFPDVTQHALTDLKSMPM